MVRAWAKFLTAAILLAAGSCSWNSQSVAEPDQALQPGANVLLITLDTLRADYLACYGNANISTPNIDALAAQGVRFETAVAQVPLTTPSHASILTGTYPQVHKLRDIGGFVLDNQVPTLASLARDAGYETAAFVSAAVLDRSYGLDRGFSTYIDDMAGSDHDDKLPGVVAEVRGDVITDRAIEWFENRAKKPNAGNSAFLLWVHYYDPHFPYDPPEPYRTRYQSDLYAGEAAYTDEQVGRLLEFLAQKGVIEDTLVILLSDHGESLGEHGEYTHGVFLYDSTMRIPLIVAGPGIPSQKVVEQQVRSIDLLPTIADYLGLTAGEQVQGTSLIPVMTEDRPVRTHYAYMETLYPKTQMGWSELRAMRTNEWKLIAAPTAELYDLENDRAEEANVYERNPTQGARLEHRIWEIDGPPGTEKNVDLQPVDQETWERLRSLGYVGAGTPTRLKLDATGPDPKDRVHVLEGLERATGLMNTDRFAAAVPILKVLLKDDSTNPLLYQHLGLCLQETGRFQEARQAYLDAIGKQADTDRTHAELGEIYIRLGDLNQAVKSMRHAAEMNPRNIDNMSNLANAYLEMGDLQEAEKAVEAVLAQREDHSLAHNIGGLIHLARSRPDLARQSFERAIASNPDLVEAYMNLGLLAHQAGRKDQAIHYFEEFLERAKDKRFREIVPKVKAALADLKAG